MARCMKPFFIADKKAKKNLRMEQKKILVPCGSCPNCLAARASAWSFRLMQEHKASLSAYFITLTYNSDHVPITENGYLSLKKSDLQSMFKRLRTAHDRNVGGRYSRLKYYAVGEYGGKLKRPHYHVILFNADKKVLFDKNNRLILDAFGLDGKVVVSCRHWDKGHVTIGSVTPASVGYTLKYISKPYRNFQINDDREKPFSVMSKRLGLCYLENEKVVNWHMDDKLNRMYVNVGEGKKIAMPRYYKDKLYYDGEREDVNLFVQDKLCEEIYQELLKYSCEAYDELMRNRRESKFASVERFIKETKCKNYERKNSKSLQLERVR